MAATPSLGIFPLRKRAKPRAQKMTSVLTSTVELATEVHRRDSNQLAKWRASRAPLAAQERISRPLMRFSSPRYRSSRTGSSRTTVQPRRQVAVKREGAWDQRTKKEEKAAPSTPRNSTALGLAVSFVIGKHPLCEKWTDAAASVHL